MYRELVNLAQRLVEAAPDAIIFFADRGGVIRLWLPGIEVLFGYSAEEAAVTERHKRRG